MYSVLYVDDEPDLLDIAKIFLEQTGDFSIDTSVSAIKALETGKILSYDAIVSDYQMPKMNGIEFLRQIRSFDTGIPFILFTGRGREEVVIEAINNGADFYLQKGGDPVAQFAELAHKLRQAVARRQVERSLVESEKRLADIINFLPDATFAIDRSGKVIAWNRAIEDLTGVPSAEMIGKGEYEYALPFYGTRRKILIDLIFEPDDVIAASYGGVIREKDLVIAESSDPKPRGRTVTLVGKASPLYNRQGGIVGAIESIRDITESRRNEEVLQKMSEEVQMIFRNMINAFIVWESVFDENGNYVSFRFGHFNDAFAEIAGLKFEDVFGKDVFEVWPGTEQSWVEAYGEVARTGIPKVFDMYH
ncbi:MAG: PAS domain S-box protein, partial [Methanoregulaceae archaeon]|nr:PAS domain S-box protein [Methanoregulaceae archaeon]